LKGIGNQFEKETHMKKKVKSHVSKFDDGSFRLNKTAGRELQVSKQSRSIPGDMSIELIWN